ncbi:MAG: RluA family pseudouridine synthase [Flavobacteriaceae bacterium]|nr:RluA family pseudouridine synthase [Flavobacteriaceae bacterium]
MIETHTVPELGEKVRLQDYAVGIFKTLVSRKGTKKAIKKRRLTINGKLAFTGDWIHGGEEISLLEDRLIHLPSTELKLEILFEDEYMAAVYKPAGILVSGNKRHTLENALSSNLSKSKQIDALLKPQPLHRLDYPTTGVLLVGKTANVTMKLKKMFETRKVEKMYHAVTIGNMENYGEITSAIDGKQARSEFILREIISSEKYTALNLVQLIPHTGRRHQLRKHLLEIGNPILGDPVYKLERDKRRGGRLYLHATAVKFDHPITHESIEVVAPFPKKFIKLFPSLGSSR